MAKCVGPSQHVVPAKAGTQGRRRGFATLDSRCRGNDARATVRFLSAGKITASPPQWSVFMPAAILVSILQCPAADAQSPPAAAGVRAATPEEVRQRLDAEAAAIAAETPFDGFDRALTHYIRANLPALEPVSRADALAFLGASPEDFAASPPFVCHGDFTGDGLEDTAAIMRDRKTDELTLMAFHQIHVFANPGPITTLGYSSYTLHQIGPLREPRRLDEARLPRARQFPIGRRQRHAHACASQHRLRLQRVLLRRRHLPVARRRRLGALHYPVRPSTGSG